MRWVIGSVIAVFAWLVVILSFLISSLANALSWLAGGLRTIASAVANFASEIKRLRGESAEIARDIAALPAEQSRKYPFTNDRKTIFLLITCGQAVRIFLVSEVLGRLKQRFNVVILSPYAYSDDFLRRYAAPGVHVLPWFENFRTMLERFFQYYLMKMSGSRTHESWLKNLEARAKLGGSGRMRFLKHLALRRSSDGVGAVLGRSGMQEFYGSYFHAYLSKPMFRWLFETYRPVLVISTTAHHAEAWPLTYHAQQNGCRTLANILSWDNPTTKPAMDTSCDYYTVWSEEMKREMQTHFPYLRTTNIVTGTPLFDLYYKRPGAEDRAGFLGRLGLPADLPYVLWTTNTPSGMPDEHIIIREFWHRMQHTPMAGSFALLVRLHPKESAENYLDLKSLPNVALTTAGDPHWSKSDRWLPDEDDMGLLLNSMIHASVSINVASTMSLESFACGLPTINVAFKSTDQVKDHGLLWSFDMYHASDHYRALVENGAVEIVRSMDELVAAAVQALRDGTLRADAMRATLAQKADYCDGTAAQRFCEVIEEVATLGGERFRAPAPNASNAAVGALAAEIVR